MAHNIREIGTKTNKHITKLKNNRKQNNKFNIVEIKRETMTPAQNPKQVRKHVKI